MCDYRLITFENYIIYKQYTHTYIYIIYIANLFAFQGTNVDKAKKLISDAKLEVISVDDFAQAAETSVKLALIMNLAKSLDLDIHFIAKLSGKMKISEKPKK